MNGRCSAWGAMACLVLGLSACSGPDLLLGDYGPRDALPPEADEGPVEPPPDAGVPSSADAAVQAPRMDSGHPDDEGPEDGGEPDGEEAPACSEPLECQDQPEHPFCDTSRGRCAECLAGTDCVDPQDLACLEGRCVQCRSDADCADTETCEDGECEG